MLNKGESITVDAINFGTATVTAAVKKGAESSTNLTATVSGGAVTIAAKASAVAGTDYTVTLTAGSDTTVVNVTVI